MKGYKNFALAAVLACAAASGAALAHKGATGIVKERMHMMESMADAMKAIAPMMKGEAVYDPSVAEEFASELARRAVQIKAAFPEGSAGHPSEASLRIWQEPERFEASAEELRAYARELEEKAATGADTARLLFGRIAGTCKDCHQSFREERN